MNGEHFLTLLWTQYDFTIIIIHRFFSSLKQFGMGLDGPKNYILLAICQVY